MSNGMMQSWSRRAWTAVGLAHALLFAGCAPSKPAPQPVQRAVALAPATRSATRPAIAEPARTTLVGQLPAELVVRKNAVGHLLVAPVINGQAAGWFILDTGAGMSCVDKNLVQRLGLPDAGAASAMGSGGTQATRFRTAASLELGPVRLEDAPVVELDLAAISLAVGQDLGGIIGYEWFVPAIVEIDLEAGRISLHDRRSYRLPAGQRWHDLSFHGRRPAIRGRIEDHEEGLLIIDTGANGAIVIHAPAVNRFDLLNGRETRPSTFGGVGGTRPSRTGTLSSLTLAGNRLEDVEAVFSQGPGGALAESEVMAVVGVEALKNFRLILDYGNSRAALIRR